MSLKQLRDINVVVVTDVHSWIAGHGRQMNGGPPADYGDVLSFYRHLKRRIEAAGKDVFFVMNGDFVDGTGLSGVPPIHLTPLLQQMPFDAVNVGNHELYHDDTVEFLQSSGFIDHWGGKYLSSNTFVKKHQIWDNSTAKTPLGSQYAYLYAGHSGANILTLGFLYNFTNNCPLTYVQPVQETIEEEWFANVVKQKNYDAVLVLAHMDYADELVGVLHRAIRRVSQRSDIPIQFINGHSHRRGATTWDLFAASMEAGHFLDTVGMASFDVHNPVSPNFSHVFWDANVPDLRRAIGIKRKEDWDTSEGVRLSLEIRSTRNRLGLSEIVGCAPETYRLKDGSLWKLYSEKIAPTVISHASQRTNPNAIIGNSLPTQAVFVQSMGALRYDLFEGYITLDNLVQTSPFNDTLCYLGKFSSSQLQALQQLAKEQHSTGMPLAWSARFNEDLPLRQPSVRFDLWAVSFDIPRLSRLIETSDLRDKLSATRSNQTCNASKLTSLDLWITYFRGEWAMCHNSSLPYLHLHAAVQSTQLLKDPQLPQQSAFLLGLLVVFVSLLFILRTFDERQHWKSTGGEDQSLRFQNKSGSGSQSYGSVDM